MKNRLLLARSGSRSRRGSILVVSLLVVVGVAMLGACLLQFSVSLTRGQIQGIDKKRAFYVAEAGLSEGFYGLIAGKSGNIGTAADPARFGDGVVWVESTEMADGRYRLESTGLCGGGRASLSIVVEKKAETTASLGIFSDGDMVVKAGSTIDSFDSGADGGLVGGIVGGVLPTPVGCVGSNGSIDVRGSLLRPTKILGDVTPGPNGSVTSALGVTISGSTAPRSAPVALPKIKVPPLTSLGDLVHDKPTERVIPAGQHRFGSLTLGPTAQLTITGPQVLVVDSLVLGAGAKLTIDPSAGDVEIHVTDYLNFGESSTVVNTKQLAESARLLISASRVVDRNGDGTVDPPVSIRATGKLHATVYAPSAQVALGNSMELFGAITAAGLALSEGAKLHFDEALIDSDAGATENVKLLSWKVLELPDAPLVSLRLDPVAALLASGATLVDAADAHQVVDFKIRYTDALGDTVTWAGDETAFDWTKVQTVQLTTRIGDALFNDL